MRLLAFSYPWPHCCYVRSGPLKRNGTSPEPPKIALSTGKLKRARKRTYHSSPIRTMRIPLCWLILHVGGSAHGLSFGYPWRGWPDLLGPEAGDLLGVIRLRSCWLPGDRWRHSSFFTRAVDFGFTKSVDETLSKWGHDPYSLPTWFGPSPHYRPDVVICSFQVHARRARQHRRRPCW